jgi:thiosulfate/3-mercaptopyruvate sulfurtransferase
MRGRHGPLLMVADLASMLDGPDRPVLLDVRWWPDGPPGLEAYWVGRLPTASYVDLDAELCGPPGPGGRRPLPDPTAFTASMRRHGVRADRTVVAYDAADSTAAARLWWLLRYFGHGDVRVLDGGYAAWRAAGQPVQSGRLPAGPSAGNFLARPGGVPTLDAEAAARLARHGMLLDARSAERYCGAAARPGESVTGHIPGAVSAPSTANVDRSGRFRSPTELRARFAGLGINPQRHDVGVYCGSGLIATHEVLALEIAGISAALYPGSWSHWTTDPTRPVATGENPG